MDGHIVAPRPYRTCVLFAFALLYIPVHSRAIAKPVARPPLSKNSFFVGSDATLTGTNIITLPPSSQSAKSILCAIYILCASSYREMGLVGFAGDAAVLHSLEFEVSLTRGFIMKKKEHECDEYSQLRTNTKFQRNRMRNERTARRAHSYI